MSRGAFVVPNGGFGMAKARERVAMALDKFVPYFRLRLRQRPRAGRVTVAANDVAVMALEDGRWTLINSSTSIFDLRIDPKRSRTVQNVLPALVALGLVSQTDRVAIEAWLCEEQRHQASFGDYKKLRGDAERLGYKVVRASGEDARKRRAGVR